MRRVDATAGSDAATHYAACAVGAARRYAAAGSDTSVVRTATEPSAPRTTQPPITAAEGAALPGAEESIRELVRQYAQALESRSIEAVKRVWPSLQGAEEEAMRREFLNTDRIDVDVGDINITVSGSSGTVHPSTTSLESRWPAARD